VLHLLDWNEQRRLFQAIVSKDGKLMDGAQ
jgi:hypothetical protein